MSDNEKALIAAAGAGNVEEIRRLKNLGTNLDAVTATKYAERIDAIGLGGSLCPRSNLVLGAVLVPSPARSVLASRVRRLHTTE